MPRASATSFLFPLDVSAAPPLPVWDEVMILTCGALIVAKTSDRALKRAIEVLNPVDNIVR